MAQPKMRIFRAPIFRSVFMVVYRLWRTADGLLHRYLFNNLRVFGTKSLYLDGHRIRMYAAGDDGIVDALYFTGDDYGEYEEVTLFGKLAAQSKVVLDIGANTGLYTIIAKREQPSARVIAFEPYPVNADRLRKNLALNGLSGAVNIVEKAVGDEEGTVTFAVPEKERVSDVLSADVAFTQRFSTTSNRFETARVPQITLDGFVQLAGLERVDLVKIDVENYEMAVLTGALSTLARFDPILIVEIFVNADRIAFFDRYLKPLGYQCYLIGKKGLFRTGGLVENPDCRNYLLAKTKSPARYLSFSGTKQLIREMEMA